MPKVSICIPAYRQPDFLRKTLQSIFSQSFTDYEVIVTDDSQDDSLTDTIKEFQFDPRLRYFRNRNAKGSPENWNEAVRLASGDYIKVIHHDDWFAGIECLGRYVKMLDENPDADFAYSATIVSSVTSGMRTFTPSQRQREELRKDPRTLFYGNIIGAPSATIYRRGIPLDYDVKMKWLVDVDFYIRVLTRNSIFVHCSDALICTTDGAPHQVTNECLADKCLQIFEYTRLYKKIFDVQTYNARQFRLFWKMLRRSGVNSVDDLYRAGVTEPLPVVIVHALKAGRALRWFL